MDKRANFLALLMILGFTFTMGFATDIEKLLTVADVEKETGLQGIQLIPKNPMKGAGGDLNFALAGKDMMLMVSVQDSSLYEQWKNLEGNFYAEVPDIGDEAFKGPGFTEVRYLLVFRKGNKAVLLSTFLNLEAEGEPFLKMEQLTEFAKIIISRL